LSDEVPVDTIPVFCNQCGCKVGRMERVRQPDGTVPTGESLHVPCCPACDPDECADEDGRMMLKVIELNEQRRMFQYN